LEAILAFSTLWRRVRLVLTYVVLFIGIVWTVHWEHVPPGSFGARLDRILRGEYFDFVTWEAEALTDKLRQELTTPQDYIDDAARKQIVLDYLDLEARINQVESEISRNYTDPEVSDPDAASAEKRAALDQLHVEQAKIQGTAEAILEEQIGSVLEDEGFGYLGEIVPPVRFQFTPLPKYLIISPRNEIALTYGAMLRGDIQLDRTEQMESQIDADFDVSSLVEPIGGLAVFPAMMHETSSLSWALEATAHEWVHHFFFFWLKPVGLYYEANPDVRTINETAADIVGNAIKDKVLARYYPEFVPPPTPSPDSNVPPPLTPEPPEFDFIAQMRETRVNVDRLLAEGKIEEAENYMELRRRIFVENGYNIRKLNQAYFAFHGAYASEPGGGAAGDNPVGGPVQELWAANPAIKTFLNVLAPITNREMLFALLEEMGIEYPPPTSDQN
jgi:hypothetical protein